MRMKFIDKIRMKKNTGELSQIYGTLIFFALTFYFLLMYAVGLIHVVELRFVNIFFMITGVYLAMRQYRTNHNGELNYFRALALGTATGFIATTTFGIFLFFFLQLEGDLMQSIRANEPIGQYLNPYIATCVVMMEGALSGFGVSYMLVNYMSTDKATTPSGGDIPTADFRGFYGTKDALTKDA
jgi:EamA domain-containing membrane protein RarD